MRYHLTPQGQFKVRTTPITDLGCRPKATVTSGTFPLLLGLQQGYPLHNWQGRMHEYHPIRAWLVEQKALPSQLLLSLYG